MAVAINRVVRAGFSGGAGRGLYAARLVVWAMMALGWARAAPAAEGPRLPEMDWTLRSDWTDVRAAGAKGDGVADDTAAIQSALKRLSDKLPGKERSRYVVYFPPGKYRITRTLTATDSTGAWLIGHGRSTIIRWDGPAGGNMYRSDACRFARYEGITWDGQGKAGNIIEHQTQVEYESWVRYEQCAFLNATETGVAVNPRAGRSATGEIHFNGCIFDNCKVGVSFSLDYNIDNVIDGCEFFGCGVGVKGVRGNWHIHGCRFTSSGVADVRQESVSQPSSIRLCVSTGSRRFLETERFAYQLPMQIQGCTVSGWTAEDGAISLGHPGPVTMFDCAFIRPPNGNTPVVLNAAKGIAQSMIISGNSSPGSVGLLRSAPPSSVIEIPAGKRKALTAGLDQRFKPERLRVPGKILDAKVNFGAKGDGQTDDAESIQRCIDAARAQGNDCIAYLPGGRYMISQTLKIGGSGYFFGGAGYSTELAWKGPDRGTAIQVDTPQNVVLQNFRFELQNNRYIRIRETASGRSSVVFDQILLNDSNDPLEGLICQDLPKEASVRIGMVRGKLRFSDCGQADILAAMHSGPVIIDGDRLPKTGLTVLMFNMSLGWPGYGLTVRDNQDVVVGAYRLEGSGNYLLCEGGNRRGKGRVAVGGSEALTHAAETVTLHNYEGRVWIGGLAGFWQEHAHAAVKLKQEGTRPAWLISCGNEWMEVEPAVEFAPQGKFVRVGDTTFGPNAHLLPNLAPTGAEPEVTGALDDFRELAAAYLGQFPSSSPKKK